MPASGNIWVDGEGPWDAELMLVGESPGHEEEKQRRPFIGKTGIETENYLRRYVGLSREQVRITNLFKYGLTDNDKKKRKDGSYPYEDFIGEHEAELLDEIERVRPRVIMTLGAISTHWFLGDRFDMEALNSIPHYWKHPNISKPIVVVPSLHPAAALRTNSLMSWIIKAFESVRGVMGGKIKPTPYAPRTEYTDEWEPPEEGGYLAVDTETRKVTGAPLLVQWSTEPYKAHYAWVDREKGQKTLKKLKAYSERDDVKLVIQNALFDIPVLEQVGIRPKKWIDTMLIAFLIQTLPLGLKALAYHLCRKVMREYEDVVGDKKLYDLSDVDEKEALDYACDDPDATIQVFNAMLPMWYERMDELLEVDMGIQPMLLAMMRRGFGADRQLLKDIEADLSIQLLEMQYDMIEKWPIVQECAVHKEYKKKGRVRVEDFNPGSDKQKAELLYKRLGLGRGKNIAKNRWGGSVAADELKKIEMEHPIVPILQKYEELDTLKSGFAEALPTKIRSDGRIHSKISMIRIPHSGRLAFSDPNLTAIPTRTPEGRRIREAFIPEDGYVLLSQDYSQIEMRLMAHLSRDEVMCEIYNRDGDIHAETAAKAFGLKSLDEVDEMKHRYPAKRTGFGVLNDLSPEGLQRELLDGGAGLWDVEDCKDFIRTWFGIYKGVRKYKDKVREIARKDREIIDMWGRRELIPHVISEISYGRGRYVTYPIREAGLRVAGNQQIQSGAQGIIKRAMMRLWYEVMEEWVRDGIAYPLVQIHDDIVMEVLESELQYVASVVKDIMENTVKLIIPVRVDQKWGKRWGKMEKLK